MKRGKISINKKSQVTLFIILAILIVAVLIFIFYPRIKVSFFTAQTPQEFIDKCLESDIKAALNNLTNQGGSMNPQNAILYKDKKIEYLCYVNEYYRTCVMQQPFLKQHFEQELATAVKSKTEDCMNELVADYQSKGYQVTRSKAEVSVSFVPHNMKIEVNSPLTLKKEATESHEKFIIIKRSELYDLLMTSQSILNWEARYGDSAPETFMLYYPDLKVEKLKQGDGSKIYNITNRQTKESFIFASRSLSWPAGYQTETYIK